MKQVLYIFTAINMIACIGPDQETLVDELRVMAIQAEPAEVQLRDFIPNESGETANPVLNVVIGDPLETGYQLAVLLVRILERAAKRRNSLKTIPLIGFQLLKGQRLW